MLRVQVKWKFLHQKFGEIDKKMTKNV
jgi:hypothetical protein